MKEKCQQVNKNSSEVITRILEVENPSFFMGFGYSIFTYTLTINITLPATSIFAPEDEHFIWTIPTLKYLSGGNSQISYVRPYLGK